MREVKLWVESRNHEPVLVLRQFVEDDVRVETPHNLWLKADEHFRWESTTITSKPVVRDHGCVGTDYD